MTRPANEAEIAEVSGIIAKLLPIKSLVSRDYIHDLVTNEPKRYPALMALPVRMRLKIIAEVMNQRFFLWNQAAQKPRGKVWMLTTEKKTEVQFASC